MTLRISYEDPPPCNSGIIGKKEDPQKIITIPYSHYYRVGGPSKESPTYSKDLERTRGVAGRKQRDRFSDRYLDLKSM